MEQSPTVQEFALASGVPIRVDGVFNVRGFGGYPSNPKPNCFTRDRIIYRSGHLKDITPRGLEQIRGLRISTIIDLTNSGETKSLFTGNLSLDHCKVVHFPLAKHEFSVQQLAEKYKRYLELGEKAIAEGYYELLTEGHETIGNILALIRDNPSDVFLVHCAMGKDRTGVVFAVLLSLAGVPDDVIAEEYSRSESALEASLPEIAAAIKKAMPTVTDTEAEWRAKIVIQTRKEAMLLMLQMVTEQLSGMKEYLKTCCSVSDEDIKRLQDILTCTRTGSN
ncbi:hypothetical protein BDW74DRAFT_168590 [Aspergillus multicolor]|uniref:tyrosine-protein phosphatase n=1 Tax=Aspergillus multicolor TaxID=41759 RepID=UPI003CCE1163